MESGNKGNQPLVENVTNDKDVVYISKLAGINSEALTEAGAKLILELYKKVESMTSKVIIYDGKSDSYIGRVEDIRVKFPGDLDEYEDGDRLDDKTIILVGFPDDGVVVRKDKRDYVAWVLSNADVDTDDSEDLDNQLTKIVRGIQLEGV